MDNNKDFSTKKNIGNQEIEILSKTYDEEPINDEKYTIKNLEKYNGNLDNTLIIDKDNGEENYE